MAKFNKIRVILFTVALIASSFSFSANAGSAPSLSDQSVIVTGPHNAVLTVYVNPNDGITDIHFKYWTGSDLKERLYLGVRGISSIRIDVGLINLLEGRDYSYQIVAVNSYGTTTGNIDNFSTSGSNSNSSNNTSNNSSSSGSINANSTSQTSPSVTTNGPASVSSNSAVINGSVNSNGTSTTFWFEFGTTQSLGQITTTQLIGSGNNWQLVTGNLSNLDNNRTYYYRVVAQNNYGINRGEIRNFTTGVSQAGGQVLGSVSGASNGTAVGTATSVTRTRISSKNPRPSFISLEYSLDANGALVLIANNLKPKPGEEFSYTIITKNDSQASFNETSLKVLLPIEVDYVGANIEPLRVFGTVIEFDLGTIQPLSRNETVVTVRVKEKIKPETNMIFTSVLGYKDKTGTQLATTSYMTVKVGQGGSGVSLSALSLGALTSSTGMLILVAVGLLILMGLLTYKFVKIRNGKNGKNKKSEEEDIFSKGGIPSTFEPISDGSFLGR